MFRIGAFLCAAALCAAPARSQALSGREAAAYDPGSVEVVRGEVVRLQMITHPDGRGMHLVLRTGAKEDLAVALGPARIVERALRIRAGDRVEITGFRVVRGKPAFVATEVRKGDVVLQLRDRYGLPVWEREGREGRSTTWTIEPSSVR